MELLRRGQAGGVIITELHGVVHNANGLAVHQGGALTDRGIHPHAGDLAQQGGGVTGQKVLQCGGGNIGKLTVAGAGSIHHGQGKGFLHGIIQHAAAMGTQQGQMRTLGVGFVHKKGVGALGVEFLPGVPLQGIRQPAQVPRKAGAGGRGALVGDGQQLQKFHLTTGSQHIVNAQHGIAAVGQHQSPDAGLLHLFQHSLGVTAQIGVGAALRAGKTFRQRIQRREGGPIPGKQLQRGVFAGIINRFAHTSASCLLCSISRKASSRVAVWPSIVLARSQPSPSSSSTG